MHKTPEWILVGLALVWLATPWVFVALAWKKWARTRTKGNPLEDLIDDSAFLIGQILATVSCCALIPLFIPALYWWGRMEAVDHGLIISLGFRAYRGLHPSVLGLSAPSGSPS